MKTCPKCGSTNIISNLIVLAPGQTAGGEPVHVVLEEPPPVKKPFVWMPKTAQSGFVAAVCGNCGHTEFSAPNHAALLAAHKQGYRGRQTM